MTAMLNEWISSTELNSSGFTVNSMFLSPNASECFVLRFDGLIPWENAHSLVSAETEDTVHRLKGTVFLPLLFLIGGPANVINMAVFFKQGLKERINVCLLALSLSDLLYMVFNITLYGEQMHLQFTTSQRYGPVMRFMANKNLLGFSGFTWLSQIISAIIASERCFCILQPLRSQTVLSTSTTTVIITIAAILMVGLYSIITTRYHVACAYDPLTGSYSWVVVASQFYLDHQSFIDILDAFVFGVGIPVVMMVVVMVTTVVTVVKLRQAAVWRAGSSSSSSVSAREVALTMMLVYNSIFFIVCVFPVALFRVVWLFVPEMNPGKSQHNLYFTFLWLLDTMTYINASFNIAVYYTMGSRYRHSFWQLLGRGSKTSG